MALVFLAWMSRCYSYWDDKREETDWEQGSQWVKFRRLYTEDVLPSS